MISFTIISSFIVRHHGVGSQIDSRKKVEDIMSKRNILIIGAGGCGLTSALTAAEIGSEVFVLEKETGGAGRWSAFFEVLHVVEVSAEKSMSSLTLDFSLSIRIVSVGSLQ